MRIATRLLMSIAAASVLTFAGPARATTPADLATAKALFIDARADASRGRHAIACPKFRESYALDAAVGTLLNLGDCDERAGHLVSALRRFEEGLGRLPPSDTRVSYVRSRIRTVEARVPRLVGSIPQSAQLFVDGVEVTTPSVLLPVDPGSHTVRVTSGPERNGSVIVNLAEGDRKDLDLAALLPPPPAQPAPVVASPPPQRSSETDARGPDLTSSGVDVPDPFAARRDRARNDFQRRRELMEQRRILPVVRWTERDRRRTPERTPRRTND